MTQFIEFCINFSDPRWNLCPGYDVVNSNKKWQGSCFCLTFSKWFWKPLTCLAYANEPSVHSSDCQWNSSCWELSKIYVSVTNDLYQMKALSFRQNSSQDGRHPLTWMWFLKSDTSLFFFLSFFFLLDMSRSHRGDGCRQFTQPNSWRSSALQVLINAE